MLIPFFEHIPSQAQPLHAMYAFALLLEHRIMCFSDQIWRLNPLYIPCQTARLQGKPDYGISWLMVHKSWSRGMMLANVRCQVRVALPDFPCLAQHQHGSAGHPHRPRKGLTTSSPVHQSPQLWDGRERRHPRKPTCKSRKEWARLDPAE